MLGCSWVRGGCSLLLRAMFWVRAQGPAGCSQWQLGLLGAGAARGARTWPPAPAWLRVCSIPACPRAKLAWGCCSLLPSLQNAAAAGLSTAPSPPRAAQGAIPSWVGGRARPCLQRGCISPHCSNPRCLHSAPQPPALQGARAKRSLIDGVC